MSSYAWACQQSLKALLTTPPIAAGGAFDDAPETVTFPWIEIGDAQIIPDDSGAANGGSDDGVSDFYDLHIWSRYRGKKEVMEIVDAVHARMHGATLTIPGRASALAWVRAARVIRDPDAITRHGIISVEIIHRS